ncbi:MAG: CobW family GTP-binding protein [Sulfitobacter sp.]
MGLPAPQTAPLPVTIIGGYLGAGKTTLINALLRHNEGQRLAVLVNEFGDLSIDADLIEAQEDGLISISGGCVCCAFGSDLIGAMEDLAARTPRPDHVLIEASGVALPASIATTISMINGFRPDGILVLADAEQIRRNAANRYLGDTVDRQLAQADLLLLTKSDLVSADALAALKNWIAGKAPGTRILPVTKGDVPISALLGAVPFPARGHRPDPGPHSRFDSLLLTPPPGTDAQSLARALAADPGVTRAKGFVQGPNGTQIIHVVGTRAEVTPAAAAHASGVVCIGLREDFNPARITALLPCTPEMQNAEA